MPKYNVQVIHTNPLCNSTETVECDVMYVRDGSIIFCNYTSNMSSDIIRAFPANCTIVTKIIESPKPTPPTPPTKPIELSKKTQEILKEEPKEIQYTNLYEQFHSHIKGVLKSFSK